MSYVNDPGIHRLKSLSNTELTETASTKLTWTIPASSKKWTLRGAEFHPTTAIGACTTACVVTLVHTPSGGSADTILTCTLTASTGVGTNLVFTVNETGEDYVDLNAGDTLAITITTAMSGGTTGGAGDIWLFLSLLP